jgi:excisionase family DNA binding protein
MRSVPEAARDLGVPEDTIQGWIETGELLAIRLGRSSMVDLGEVSAVRDRFLGERGRRGSGWRHRARRAIGLGDVVAGALGLAALAVGPADLRSPLSLALPLLCLAVGAMLLREAGLPDLARHARAPDTSGP